jgi:hypothetical protein
MVEGERVMKLLCGFYTLGIEVRSLDIPRTTRSALLDPSNMVRTCHWSETWCGTIAPGEKRVITFAVNETTRVETIHSYGGCSILSVKTKGKTWPVENNEHPRPFVFMHVSLEPGMTVEITLVGAAFMTGAIEGDDHV